MAAGAHSQNQGVIQVFHDLQGGDLGDSRGHQHLGTVGNDSLYQAGEGVQDAGAAPGRNVEAVADVLGNRTRRDNGDGVVRRA